MKLDELLERLEEIHDELIPSPSEEAMRLYDANEIHNPCGCVICRLIQDLIVQDVISKNAPVNVAGSVE